MTTMTTKKVRKKEISKKSKARYKFRGFYGSVVGVRCQPLPCLAHFIYGGYDMAEKMTPKTQATPSMVKKIGKTTYIVTAHFSEDSRETMDDKIKRMLADEVKSDEFNA